MFDATILFDKKMYLCTTICNFCSCLLVLLHQYGTITMSSVYVFLQHLKKVLEWVVVKLSFNFKSRFDFFDQGIKGIVGESGRFGAIMGGWNFHCCHQEWNTNMSAQFATWFAYFVLSDVWGIGVIVDGVGWWEFIPYPLHLPYWWRKQERNSNGATKIHFLVRIILLHRTLWF